MNAAIRLRPRKFCHFTAAERGWGCLGLLVLIVGTAKVEAQTLPTSEEKAAVQRRERIQVARQSLRDGELATALKSLETVAESSTTVALSEADDVSFVCASLHRALSQVTSEQQFDILSKWSLPADLSGKIRVLSALVPSVAPPAEFSRVLGERPGGNSFPISSIGAVRGIFSTAWSLVTAARDCGKLKKLTSDVAPLAERKMPGAELLLLFAAIAEERADVTREAEQLAARVKRIKDASPLAGGLQYIDRENLILAAAAVNHSGLCALSEEFVSALLATTNGKAAPSIRPFLHRTQATASLRNQDPRARQNWESVLATNFKYWLPVSRDANRTNWPTSPAASWLAHEDHILHLAGSPDDALLMRFPLTGDFQFQAETQQDGPAETDGGVTYGGLQFRVFSRNGEFTVRDANGRVLQSRYCPFAHQPSGPAFHQFSITSNAGTITTAVRLHPMWSEQRDVRPSPWIGLTSPGEARPLFRNLKIMGHPVIPRTASMTNEDELRGWHSQTWGPVIEGKPNGQADWSLSTGVIQAASQSPTQDKTKLNQQLLSYVRPLLAGETIHYEFFYDAGKCEVSPAIDRVAFLVQPDGVRLHWITDGDDWTLLPADNTVVEPLSRRGPRPLPLKPADWNRLSVSRAEQSVTLSLNDVVIYQRAIDWDGDHTFGLYRNGTGTDVKVREVVMTGNWPEQLPKEFLENPTVTSGALPAAAEQRALHRIFGEEFLASNVFAVRKRALAMPLAERFQYLSDWILPGPNHPGIRMVGEFTPTRPAPSAREPGVNHPELGGEIISPVFDWLDAARELGTLSECRRRVEAIAVGVDDEQQRAKLSLLLMLGLESADRTLADKEWSLLFGRPKKTETSTDDENHWPEMLLAARGVSQFPNNAQVAELVSDLTTQRMLRWKHTDVARWHNHVASLNGQILQRKRDAAAKTPADQAALRDWIPASAGRAQTFGSGHPDLKWSRLGEKVIKDSGHHLDYLFYRLPMSGEFQVECDLILPTQNPIAVMTAGTYMGVLEGLNGIETGTFRDTAPNVSFEPALTKWGHSIRYRAEVVDGTCTVFLNGRKINTVSLPKRFDPWIAFRSPGWRPSNFANVRIKGSPNVPDVVDLSRIPDLAGWIEYHEEGQWKRIAQSDGSVWIVGQSNPAYAGIFAEGLLRYQRPLQDRESIEYEFFYQPGSVETAPALDRLAFVLHPAGVREHWITDGRHGPVSLAPDNLDDVAANRRGPTVLPLKAGEWNRLLLKIRGTTALIELNGQLVYERVLESENQRAFGLFHHVGETESRVRNLNLRGDWPKTLPVIADQELAGDTLEWINADLPRLKSVFPHRFDKEGLPEEYFENLILYPITITKDGAYASLSSDKTAVNCTLSPRFSVSGDFDIEASFTEVSLAARTRDCSITLRTIFDEPQKPAYDILRFMNEKGLHLARAAQWFSQPANPGGQMWRAESDAWESASGRMRLARRGKKLYNLIADGDAGTFRLVSAEEVSQADLVRHGIQLHASASGGTTNVTWKEVSLRAERMTWYPPPPKTNQSLLKVIQADGSGSRTIVDPSSVGFPTVNSPEWSADGRRIILDASNGSPALTHIFSLNADGTDPRDLGLGCMPSFSADGEQVAFSQPGMGIMTMKADGTDRQVVDRQGWGTQWSPDGKWLAYGKTGNITLLNLATRESRELFAGESAMRYRFIYHNLAWSHDSCAIAFKGRKRDTNVEELIVSEIDAPNHFAVIHTAAASVVPDFSFSPDNKQVLAAVDPGDGKGHRLHTISRSQPVTMKLLDFVPAGLLVSGLAWSHDGKTIVVSCPQVAEPTEWLAGMKSSLTSK